MLDKEHLVRLAQDRNAQTSFTVHLISRSFLQCINSALMQKEKATFFTKSQPCKVKTENHQRKTKPKINDDASPSRRRLLPLGEKKRWEIRCTSLYNATQNIF